MYIFDMELPLVLCDLGELLTDYAACLTSCDPADLLNCNVTGCLVSGPADQKWENCMTGEGGVLLCHLLFIRPEVIFKKSFNLYWHQDLGMRYQ